MSRMNNDLISRTAVLQILYDVKDDDDTPKNYGTLLDIIRQIRELPVAFDKEKVIEHLTNLANAEVDMSDDEEELVDVEDWFDEGRSQGRFEAYRNSLEIVKKGGIE